jgi:hypothetical protein
MKITSTSEISNKKKGFTFQIPRSAIKDLVVESCNIQDFKKLQGFKYLFRDSEVLDSNIVIQVYTRTGGTYIWLSESVERIHLNNKWTDSISLIQELKDLVK